MSYCENPDYLRKIFMAKSKEDAERKMLMRMGSVDSLANCTPNEDLMSNNISVIFGVNNADVKSLERKGTLIAKAIESMRKNNLFKPSELIGKQSIFEHYNKENKAIFINRMKINYSKLNSLVYREDSMLASKDDFRISAKTKEERNKPKKIKIQFPNLLPMPDESVRKRVESCRIRQSNRETISIREYDKVIKCIKSALLKKNEQSKISPECRLKNLIIKNGANGANNSQTKCLENVSKAKCELSHSGINQDLALMQTNFKLKENRNRQAKICAGLKKLIYSKSNSKADSVNLLCKGLSKSHAFEVEDEPKIILFNVKKY